MKMPSEVIREEILKCGVISFARFMELALYCPETGYYETNEDNVGRRGDFVTSVSTGSLFGELLAFQFAEWLRKFQISNVKCQIIEAGAHDGKLAADILGWLKTHCPELFSEIEYVILEPSLRRQGWQQETLRNFGSRVRWISQFSNPAIQQSHGIIFSNELLDAFPVHRYGWDAKNKTWFEWGVTLDGEKLVWKRIPHPASRIPLPPSIRQLPAPLLAVLPDHYTVEHSPAAGQWWREAAGILARGRLVTIDYGYTATEQISPARTRGTLRAYHRHRVSDDLLAQPGEQDLTAHVNFSALQNAGEASGLATETFCSQPQFLTRILQQGATDNSFAGWDASRRRQFQTLTHPEHLGRAFRVLVQTRGQTS